MYQRFDMLEISLYTTRYSTAYISIKFWDVGRHVYFLEIFSLSS